MSHHYEKLVSSFLPFISHSRVLSRPGCEPMRSVLCAPHPWSDGGNLMLRLPGEKHFRVCVIENDSGGADAVMASNYESDYPACSSVESDTDTLLYLIIIRLAIQIHEIRVQ